MGNDKEYFDESIIHKDNQKLQFQSRCKSVFNSDFTGQNGILCLVFIG